MFRSEKFISMSVIKFQAFTKFFFLVSIFVCSNYLISSNVQNRSQAKSFSNEAWPQFRGNPNLTGLTISDNPELTDLRWTFDVGDSIESSAAISDGMVYVGSQSGNLLAISLGSRGQGGILDWKVIFRNSCKTFNDKMAGGIKL